jgi:hypothetical protein
MIGTKLHRSYAFYITNKKLRPRAVVSSSLSAKHRHQGRTIAAQSAGFAKDGSGTAIELSLFRQEIALPTLRRFFLALAFYAAAALATLLLF